MKKLPITVIILTYNEEVNLEQCLKSIHQRVEDIVVVDSYSEDDTIEIAEEYNARVFKHEFENQAKQFNWALDNIEVETPWIMRLDADEWVMDELWEELEEKLHTTPKDTTGFYMKRRVIFMGRWIKHGGYYPTWLLRLFRTGKGRVEDREMDEHIYLLEGEADRLENDFVDENHKPLHDWIAKHNRFSTREVKARMKQGAGDTALEGQAGRKRRLKGLYNKLPLFLRALLYWKYRYFIKLGFLDGLEGLIFHFLQGFWHQFTIDAKIYEHREMDSQ